MAYQNIAAVEPHPTLPDSALVRFRDGSTMPAPRAIAEKFDPRLSLAASGATAQLMSQPEPVMSSMPSQTASDVPAAPSPLMSAAPPREPQMSAMPREVPPPPVFAVSSGGPQQPAPQAPDMGAIDIDTGLSRRALERAYAPVYSPGRAAYDPEKDNASRRAVRESQTEQRSQGYWDEDARANVLLNQREAIQAKAEAENLASQSAAQAQRLYAAELQQQAEQQQAQQRAEEEAWKTENLRLSQEAKQVAQREADPNRVFSNASPWQGIVLALAAGMRGWATQGRDNSVAEQVQRMVDRDVAIQQDAIARQKGTVDNALFRNAQRYGSIEAGRAATKAAMYQATLAKLDANKVSLGQAADQARIEATRKALEAQAVAEFEQLKATAMGTTTTAVASSMRAPRAAVAGGYRMPTEKEVAARLEREQGVAGRGADIVGKRVITEGKDLENERTRQKGITPEEEKDLKQRVATYGQRRTDTEAAQAKIDRFLAENGIKRDKSGNLVPPSDIAGFGRIGHRVPGTLVSQQGINNRAAIEGIVYDSVKSAFGAANDKQVEMIADRIIGNGTPEHITAQLNQLQQELQAQRDNLSGSFDPEVVSEYERNKGAQRQKQDAKAKFFEPVNLNAPRK